MECDFKYTFTALRAHLYLKCEHILFVYTLKQKQTKKFPDFKKKLKDFQNLKKKKKKNLNTNF